MCGGSPGPGRVEVELGTTATRRTELQTDEKKVYKEKLERCIKVHRFDESETTAEQKLKTETLTELIDCLDQPSGELLLAEDMLSLVFQMIRANAFRPFHFVPKVQSSAGTMYEADDEETLLEPSWPHLQLVYQLFLRVLLQAQFTGELARRHCDRSFLKQVQGNSERSSFGCSALKTPANATS